MPYLPTAQVFLEQSRLLLSARPTTARITTKYTLPNLDPSPSKYKPKSTKKSEPEQSSSAPSKASPSLETAQARPPKATLTLKTYDPASGVCLKYQTDKGAEVGRLIAALGTCGRVMAALPDKEEVNMDIDGGSKDVSEAHVPEGKGKPLLKEGGKDAKNGLANGGQRAGGGGGGKKKKGKR